MKKVVLILLIAGLIALAVVTKLRMDARRHLRELRQENADMQRKMDDNLKEIQATIAAWRYCHSNPPTTKAHQLECKKLDEWAAANASKDKW
jgi:ABC-type multidrug transport system fused ATPase/permease subunit